MAKNFKTFFVVNPKAGHGRGCNIWEKVRPEITRQFGACDFAYTNARGHGIVLTTEALHKGYEMVVTVGGDGTINEVVNGFFEEGKPVTENAVLGILPAGTGGDYVRSLSYPKFLEGRVRLLTGRRTRQVDLGHVSFRTIDGLEQNRFFVNIAGCGLPGELVDEISKMPRTYGGKVAYLLGLAKALKRHKNQWISVEVDQSERIEKKAMCGVIANGQYFGSGMHVAPQAVLDDGLLDFVLVGDISVMELMRNLPKLYTGKVGDHPEIETYRAKEIRIRSKAQILLDLDGEQTGVLPATYTVLQKALRIKVG